MNNSTSRRRFIRGGAGVAATAVAVAASPAPTNSTDALTVICGLRTIHGDFSDRQVPDRDVQRILDASVRAANASGIQSYSIVVVKDSERMHQLTGYRASCLLLYCVDFTGLIDTSKYLGYSYSAGDMQEFITASTSTVAAAQTAVIAAKSLGIDSLLTNGIHRGDMERHWKILELPDTSCFPLIALMLGYPKSEPAHPKGRLNGPGVVHREKYQRMTKDQLQTIVSQYDDKSRHLGLNEDWDQKGHKHYLDWLYKEWLRVPSTPPAGETQTLRRLRKSGFVEAAHA